MRTIAFLLLLCFISITTSAHDWYRIYLVSKINAPTNFTHPFYVQPPSICGFGITQASIPHFERSKGAIFCRMEDYLTAKTKVWIKVGVK